MGMLLVMHFQQCFEIQFRCQHLQCIFCKKYCLSCYNFIVLFCNCSFLRSCLPILATGSTIVYGYHLGQGCTLYCKLCYLDLACASISACPKPICTVFHVVCLGVLVFWPTWCWLESLRSWARTSRRPFSTSPSSMWATTRRSCSSWTRPPCHSSRCCSANIHSQCTPHLIVCNTYKLTVAGRKGTHKNDQAFICKLILYFINTRWNQWLTGW